MDMDQNAYEIDGQIVTEEQLTEMRKEQLDGVHQSFVSKRDRWVQHRANSGVETRWRRNKDLYDGEADLKRDDTFEETLRSGPPKRKATAARSRIVINIVRPKVDQAIARMCEILLPVDDRNWGIKPTPVPDNVKAYIGDQTPTIDPQTGQPTGMTSDQEANILITEAKKKADAMQEAIDDALTECSFNSEERSQISDAVKLGTGIIVGPFPGRKSSKVWLPNPDGTSQMVITEEVAPKSFRADPWDVWFDPSCGPDHQRGEGFILRKYVTRKELRALAQVPGYMKDCIREVLGQKPNRVRVANGRVSRMESADESYEMWLYYGDIEPEDAQVLSGEAEGGDALTDVTTGMVVMVNDKIIGMVEGWIPDGSLPCDVWSWRKSEDSPHGYGLPDELEHQQRAVNAAWRQVMDNARASMGGQIVMKKGKIVPQDGDYTIQPLKVWLAGDDIDDVRGAMATFEFNSHLQELLAIADAAMKFADQETNMPQMLGGERGTAPETVGGMVMLQSNALTVPRLRVKLFDDCVTRPHIRRYYDYMMATSERLDIKGDFEVDARGVSALLERDIANQAAINLANITSNPRYAPFVKPQKELEIILKAFKVDPADLMLNEQELQQQQQQMAEQGPPPDPRIVSAQMQMEAKKMDIQDRQEQRQFEMERNRQELEFRHQNLAYNIERERAESAEAHMDAAQQREIMIAKMQADGQLTREEMERKERLELIKLNSAREMFNAEAALRVNTGAGI
jgi:hypothetical protein